MIDILIRVQRLSIKLSGSILKLICLGLYLLCPWLRFNLPSYAPASRQPGSASKIPRIIWQTNFTSKVTLPVYLNYLFNRFLSTTAEYRFITTEEREEFIASYFSERELNAYRRLQIGAAQADFWRVAVLYKHGGVYMDIDAHLVRSLERVIRGHQEVFLLTRDQEITNYFIASAPQNSKLRVILDTVVANIEQQTSGNVYELTGPGVFNAVLGSMDYESDLHWRTCNQGTFTSEYFQYMDRPGGKWTRQQSSVQVVSAGAARHEEGEP